MLFLTAVKLEMLILTLLYAYSFYANFALKVPPFLFLLPLCCMAAAIVIFILAETRKINFQQTTLAANVINVSHSLFRLAYLTLVYPGHDLLMLTLGAEFLWLTYTPIITYSMNIGRLARHLVWLQAGGLTLLSFVFYLRHPTLDPSEFSMELYALSHLVVVNWNVLLIAWVFHRSLQRLQKAKRENLTLTELVNRDELTGLLNRRGLEQCLNQELLEAQKANEFVGVAFFDLDGFKLINDSLGHQVGDELLRSIGLRLNKLVQGWGTAARMSGDEFVIITRTPDEAELRRGSRRVHEALQRPFDLQGRRIELTVSMGVSLYPQDGQTAQELLRRADTAMFSIKHNGKNAVRFYDSQLHGITEKEHLIAREMVGLTHRDELSLMFQPIYDLQNGELRSNEALLRWTHPELGAISPAAFIPLAEANGMIVPIGNWVVKEALAATAYWRAQGMARVNVSVNVSPVQLMQPEFVEFIEQELARHHLPGCALVLELTESRALYDRSQCLDVMRRLRALEVRLALDDFGEGFASLSQLRDLPLNAIKLDRHFAEGLRSEDPAAVRYARGLIKASVTLADHLGIVLVAEGVEEARQEEMLLELGCKRAQGYFYMRPRPLAELLEEVRSRGLKVAN